MTGLRTTLIRRLMTHIVGTVLLLVLASTSAHAELTSAKIERWMVTLEPVKDWIHEQGTGLDQKKLLSAGSGGMAGMFERALSEVERAGKLESFSTMLKQHGYHSPQSWVEESTEVMRTFVAINMGGKIPDAAAIEAQLETLQNSALAESQRAMMETMLKGTLAMLDEVKSVSKEDIETLRPYIKGIEQRLGHRH